MTNRPSLIRRTWIKKTLLVGVLASATAIASTSAYAAGFALTEQSVTGLGRAYAGAGVAGDDLSALTYNPAGITLLPGSNIQLGIVGVDLDLDYEGKSGQSENGRDKPAPIPSLLFTQQVTDHLYVGLGLTSPYGMKIRYGEGWEGRERGISASIITLDINPTIAWKFNKYLSIGVGASALYQHSKIKEGLPTAGLASYGIRGLDGQFEYKGSDWMWTWDIGLMISPLDTLRFGVSYRSAAHVRAKGDYTMRMSGNILPYIGVPTTSFEETTYGYGTLTTPETIYISGYWEATPKLSLSFTARWANWKNFENMRFYARDPSNLPYSSKLSKILAVMGSNQSLTSVSITNDWRSVWFLSLGADYKFTDHWTGRAGLGYEFNPITDQKLKTALIPDTQRLWISLGASWSSGKHWQIDAAVAELIGMGHKGLYDYYGEYLGKYHRVNGTLFGAAVQYHF